MGAHGGAVIQANRKIHQQAVKVLVSLASLQTAFKILDEEIKMTSRRVNALEYVLIHRIEDIIAVMIYEMDEQAREEFYRVKQVVPKKETLAKGKEIAEAAIDAPNALDAGKDEDIIFWSGQKLGAYNCCLRNGASIRQSIFIHTGVNVFL